MALFLSESVAAPEAVGTQSFAEAFAGLLDLSDKSGSLVEAIMMADYTMEKRCANLSEGETTDKIKAFAGKVWETLKSFAKTVWAKIKQIAAMITRKAKEYFAKAVAMFKGDKVKMSKGTFIKLTKTAPLLEKMIFIAEKGVFGDMA